MFSFTSSAFCNSEGGGFLRTLCGGLPLFEPYGYAVYDNGKRTADRQIQNGMLFDAYRGEANQRYGNGRGNTLTGFPAQRGMPKAHQMQEQGFIAVKTRAHVDRLIACINDAADPSEKSGTRSVWAEIHGSRIDAEYDQADKCTAKHGEKCAAVQRAVGAIKVQQHAGNINIPCHIGDNKSRKKGDFVIQNDMNDMIIKIRKLYEKVQRR